MELSASICFIYKKKGNIKHWNCELQICVSLIVVNYYIEIIN